MYHEKAFDRIEQDYLLEVLQRFGFGNSFNSWVNIFYTMILSSVKCNGNLSFSVSPSGEDSETGLPSLFAEPLSRATRKNKDIIGVPVPD